MKAFNSLHEDFSNASPALAASSRKKEYQGLMVPETIRNITSKPERVASFLHANPAIVRVLQKNTSVPPLALGQYRALTQGDSQSLPVRAFSGWKTAIVINVLLPALLLSAFYFLVAP